MTDHWDEFSKSLAEKSVPRRQSLRLLGVALAGAFLSPLGLSTAWAGGRDPCKTFCRCSGKSRQDACLAACRACNSDTSRLCGSCASGYVCTDLANDFYNCGACGYVCDEPGPYEDGACVDGHCFYSCVEGAADCGNAACTPLWADPDNCGACGNVCPESAPYCNQGVCSSESPCSPGLTLCNGVCVNLLTDMNNCGACGSVCELNYCGGGECVGNYPPDWEW
jgi:hypothetical protein